MAKTECKSNRNRKVDKGWNRNGKRGNGGAPVTDTASGSYRAPPFANVYTGSPQDSAGLLDN